MLATFARNNAPMQAIEAGIIHGNCIRCLRCVCQCPKSALHFQLHPILEALPWSKRHVKIPRSICKVRFPAHGKSGKMRLKMHILPDFCSTIFIF